MKKNRNVIKVYVIAQFFVLAIFLAGLFFVYPKVEMQLNGNEVVFSSINANVIVISDNEYFDNPRFVDIEENISFDLKPGVYYWKAENDFLQGMSKEFVIESEVGLEIKDRVEDLSYNSVENVKVNITEDGKGGFVGRVIFDSDEMNSMDEEEKT